MVVSDDLVRRLTELQLCRPADFRQARARVRVLARDLPAFDSVWIDALVQLRKLTPYQARILDGGHADQLRLGPYVIVDKLGHGPHGTTFLAKLPGRREEWVLKRLEIAAESISECRTRLQKFEQQSEGWSHTHVVIPRLMDSGQQHDLITISRWVPGLTLAELLVRRGRLPFPIVVDIARQLASGLASLHARGMAHGEIRLANIRLVDSGSATLVDGGVRPAVCPELTIHESLALDSYDGIAPELVGTGAGPNASSEIYALGCVLWQLLTGRPPYPMADSLMKLAAHQTGRIADVRSWAPDVPADVAETILAMTAPSPNERPASFEDLLRRWGRPGMGSRSRLKKYRKSFDGAVPHFTRQSEPVAGRSWPWVAACLFIAASATWFLADRGLKNQLLSIPQRMADAWRSSASSISTATPNSEAMSPNLNSEQDRDQLLPFPAASADGEIVLAEEGPYGVSMIPYNKNVTIRGVQGVRPLIRVGRDPLWVDAESVRMTNIQVECEDIDPTSDPVFILKIRSNSVVIEDCRFERRSNDQSPVGHEKRFIAWTPQEKSQISETGDAGRILVQNTVWRGDGPAIWFAGVPSNVTLSNCLKLGAGPCFEISQRTTARPVTFDLTRLTLRETGPLFRVGGEFSELAEADTIEVTANDCVFAVKSAEHGLVEFHSSRPRDDLMHAVRMSGQSAIISNLLKTMVVVDPVRPKKLVPVMNGDEQLEGLLTSVKLDFAGPATGPIENSELKDMTAPRLSTQTALPGVDVNKLPGNYSR